MMPKVSVVVPVYNVEKYLPQCLDSIANQTLRDIEIICVNDGSTDTSLQILNSYAKKDSRFVIIDKPNSGYGDSVNQGFAKAKGEYVGIVESDDWIEPTMYETLYNCATIRRAEVAKCNHYFYWTNPPRNEKANVLPVADKPRLVNPQKDQRIFFVMPCVWSAIYSRDFINKNHIRFLPTPGASYQDTSFNFKIWTKAKRVCLIPQALYHYRQDNMGSSVNNSTGKIYCVRDEWQEVSSFLHAENRADLFPLANRLKFNGYMWNFNRLAFPQNYQFLKTMHQEFKQAHKQGIIDSALFAPHQYRHLKRIIRTPNGFFLGEWWKKHTKGLRKK